MLELFQSGTYRLAISADFESSLGGAGLSKSLLGDTSSVAWGGRRMKVVLRATLSSYQGRLCPKTRPGVENRAVCSPLGANISRKSLLHLAGPCWAERPDRGLRFALSSHAHSPLHLWRVLAPSSHPVTLFQVTGEIAGQWARVLVRWARVRWGQHQTWSFGREETKVPGLHPRCP